MNIIWVSVLTVSLTMLLFNSPDTALNTIMTGSEKAVSLVIKLWAIYAVWLGILKIVEETGLSQKIAKLLKPLITFLMGKQPARAEQQIAINITSNLLGMGNASTPSGIEAIKEMYKGESVATSAMIMFLILNATNLQLIPTTIIGLRILNGSLSPNDIIIPTILASLVSTMCGVVLVKMCSKIFKDKKLNKPQEIKNFCVTTTKKCNSWCKKC